MRSAEKRYSGLLFHPTCFPNKHDAIGTLGEEAYSVLDWMSKSGQKLLQVLPLNPTGYGDSPYASFSAFACNPYLIDLPLLKESGDLSEDDLDAYKPPESSLEKVDFGWLFKNKLPVLRLAYDNFLKSSKNKRKSSFKKFCTNNSSWLNDYALFMTIKEDQEGKLWNEWPLELKNYTSFNKMIGMVSRENFEFHCYVQWIFNVQWHNFKKYASDYSIRIIGDAPIFVAYDSADVWANQDLFFLDSTGATTCVAGVPPDYFSVTGQLWGNPLYNWEMMKQRDYSWWIRRIKNLLDYVDIIRIDHFRGFAQYWEVGAGEETAINGKWVDGPGEDFFDVLAGEFSDELPIVAEDLGLITPDVDKLRNDFNLPGMKILEFAPWGEDAFEIELVKYPFKVHKYLPENYEKNCVAYLGTHDNDTFIGWLDSLNENQINNLKYYLNETQGSGLLWSALEKIWDSDANMVLVAIQDLLALDAESRLNTPGTLGSHNWSWRLSDISQMNQEGLMEKFHNMTIDSLRCQ
ncbi:MAG: 4-alpha-glucanotransferase [Spirochaetes bacterium]|nr:4-alpha-glucanotransferase [Spirochaetota bacterium]